ncbi:MAG: right-handed parallel beta-helix repeat-containing protein [bacterium]|nr:right-handed parallel beta-helix repeat-containing protein [bacterium]
MSARIQILITILIAISHTSIVRGIVREVPSEYSTIQSALESSIGGDSVRVAPGVYHEFLTCETNALTLIGWHSADTLVDFRTILDPIPASLDTPSTAVFSGDTVVVKNFVFYNQPGIRQPVWATRVGGIRHEGNFLRIVNCQFDSVSKAVDASREISAINCDFNGCLWQCLYASSTGVIESEECNFDGSGPWLVYGSSGSTFQNCTFRRSETGGTHLLQLYGQDILVSGCRFGPSGRGFSLLVVSPQGNCKITDCIFEDISGTPNLIEAYLNCPVDADTPIVISNNVFRHYWGEQSGGTTAIGLSCQTQNAGYFGVVEGNLFENGNSIASNIPGVAIAGSADLTGNIFENLLPTTNPDVFALNTPQDTIRARSNQFLEPGIAAAAENAFFDARENWWGDSTGPYHPNLNPEGLGTEVGNGVIFEPWLLQDPDSVDTNSVAGAHIGLIPEYTLSAYP